MSLEISKLNISYITSNGRQRKIIDNLSLSVKKGEIFVLRGPSGCGKTTLLKYTAGFLKKSRGIDPVVISVESSHINGKLIEEALSGFLSQEDSLFSWLSVKNNVLLPLRIKGYKINNEREAKAIDLLKMVGLIKRKDDFPNVLSGGMRRRLQLIRCLIMEVDHLVLDEPFSNLNYEWVISLCNLIAEVVKEINVPCIISTHDPYTKKNQLGNEISLPILNEL